LQVSVFWPAYGINGGWWRWALLSLDGVAPGQMVGVSASVNLPLHHKVQTPEVLFWHRLTRVARKKGHKTVVMVVMLSVIQFKVGTAFSALTLLVDQQEGHPAC